MINFFIIWTTLWLISYILIFFRKDSKEMNKDIFDFFDKKQLLATLFCAFLLYALLPLTICKSLETIFKKND
jgi:hypothetical protein